MDTICRILDYFLNDRVICLPSVCALKRGALAALDGLSCFSVRRTNLLQPEALVLVCKKNVTSLVETGSEQLRQFRRKRAPLLNLDFLGANRLSSKARVFFIYQSMLRRTAENRVSRKPAETPDEFAGTLRKTFPGGKDEVREITETFENARYTRKEISDEDARLVTGSWEKLRSLIQRKDRSDR